MGYALNLSGQEYIFHSFANNVITPEYVVGVDLDQDGDEDVICASSGDDKISWFENLGDQRTMQHIIASVTDPIYLDTKDVDADGDIDIVANSSETNTVLLFTNIGNQVFATQLLPNSSQFTRPRCSKFLDTDMDGDMDIIASTNLALIIFVNDGLQNFTTTKQVMLIDNELLIADMDLDGDPDLVARGNQQRVYLYRNEGNNVFSLALSDTERFNGVLLIHDYNEDLLPDVITLGFLPDRIDLFLNNGDFTLDHLNLVDASDLIIPTTGLTIDDIDADHDIDFLYTSAVGIKSFRWLENKGGNFEDHLIYEHMEHPIDVIPFHFNADTLTDFLIIDDEQNILRAFTLNTDRTFDLYPLGNNVPEAGESRPVDFDFDGDFDLVSLNKGFVIENHNNDQFTQRSPSSFWLEPAPFDYDQDNDADIITARDLSTTSAILLGVNDGKENYTFDTITDSAPNNIQHFVLLDVNQDLAEDIFMTSPSNGNTLFVNDGNFEFTIVDLDPRDDSRYLHKFDVDQDGDEDVIIGYEKYMAWYENTGQVPMEWHQVNLINSLYGPRLVDAGDIDLDGDIDFSISSNYQGNNHLGWLENDGNSNFTSQHVIANDSWLHRNPRLFDKENDGDLDMLEYDYPSRRLLWYDNLGDGTFTPYYFTGQTSAYINYAQASDLDKDGDLDISFDKGWYECLTNLPQVTSIVFFDGNQNGIRDPGEGLFENASVNISPQDIYYFSATPDITFLLEHPGEYILQFNHTLFPYYSLTTPGVDTVILDSAFDRDTVYFGLYPDQVILSAFEYIHTYSFLCGEEITLTYKHCNDGTVPHKTTFWMQLDTIFGSTMFFPQPDTMAGSNSFGWHIEELFPGECTTTKLNFTAPSPGEFMLGDQIIVTTYSVIDYQDLTVYPDTFYFNQPILCAYDPNDKISSPNRDNHRIRKDECISYTVRFQNVGNYPATNVLVIDTLDPNLDISTFQMIGSSFPDNFYYTLDNNRTVTAFFLNIFLPDSTSDFAGSQGYLAYRVCPAHGISTGTHIFNEAYIYFDQNIPVITNQTEHIINNNLGTAINEPGFEINRCIVYPNPVVDQLYIQLIDPGRNDNVTIVNLYGQSVWKQDILNTERNQTIHVDMLKPGIYFLILESANEIWTCRFVKL